MDSESKHVPFSSARNELFPVMQFWEDKKRGLCKQFIFCGLVSTRRPTEFSRCLVKISDTYGLDDSRNSKILNQSMHEQWIELGSSTTPIDCYVELILMQMTMTEKSKCTIACKSGQINFVVELLRVENIEHYFSQTPKSMLDVAKKYKENGVQMFTKYPSFAHNYFSRAAKCVLAFSPLEELDHGQDGADTISQLRSLLETLYLNIAACLIKQNRYEEVLHTLDYVDQQEHPSNKAIYRKALAQFHVKQFAEAIKTLERINFSASKECALLHRNIKANWLHEDEKYTSIIRKMFNK